MFAPVNFLFGQLKIFESQKEIRNYLDSLKSTGKSIGFVPTMGALHEGHLSLINQGFDQNDVMVVSIFVNPTQFNNQDDLKKYPRTLGSDLKFLNNAKSSSIAVFVPSVHAIYGDNVTSQSFKFGGLENEMEGAFREGHFDGVATVVKRLLEIVEPNRAYFGEKDFQQLQIIKKLVQLYNIPTKIIGCKIYRAKDGLAMSSRNSRLTDSQRTSAPFIYQTLKTAKLKFGTKSARMVSEWVHKQFELQDSLDLEYFIIADVETLKPVKRKSKQKTYRAFIAVYAGDIRLIDNIALN